MNSKKEALPNNTEEHKLKREECFKTYLFSVRFPPPAQVAPCSECWFQVAAAQQPVFDLFLRLITLPMHNMESLGV